MPANAEHYCIDLRFFAARAFPASPGEDPACKLNDILLGTIESPDIRSLCKISEGEYEVEYTFGLTLNDIGQEYSHLLQTQNQGFNRQWTIKRLNYDDGWKVKRETIELFNRNAVLQ